MKHTAALLGLSSILILTSAHAATEAPGRAPTQATSPAGSPAAAPKKAPPQPPKVDLNNASKKELMTLPSVGEAEADKIIANRPYISKVDLVTKAGLPEGLYLAVRDRAIVNDMKKKPAAKNAPAQK